MKVNHKEFMKVLSMLLPVIGKGEDNTCNMVTAFKDTEGNWYMGTTNNKVTLILQVPFQFNKDFRIQGQALFQLIKKLKCDELDIEVDNKVTVHTEASETEFEMITKGHTMIDCIDSVDEKAFRELPSNFIESLTECAKYTDDGNVSVLRYVYAEWNTMASANAREVFLCTLDKTVDKMFISFEDVPLLASMKVCSYAYCEDLLYFMTEEGGIVVVHPASRRERFPVLITKSDYTGIEQISMKSLTPESLFDLTDTRKIVFTDSECKSISDIVKSCMVFTGTDGSFSCKFDGYDMVITGTGRKGMHKQRVRLTEFVSPISFETKPELLLDLLERKLPMYIGKGKVVIVTENTKHLIQVSVGY